MQLPQFHEMLKASEKFVVDNSPALLTGIGVVGTLSTAILTAQATVRAVRKIDAEETLLDATTLSLESNKDCVQRRVKSVWKLYLPPLATAAVTTTAVIGANRVGTRRAAAMAAAYAGTEKAFAEYRDQVVEKIGAKKEEEVRSATAQEQYNQANRTGNNFVINTGGGQDLCFDAYTGRTYLSSMATMKEAQNRVNQIRLDQHYASLNDMYDAIGLARVPMGEEVGWNLDKEVDLNYTSFINEDNRPVLSFEFRCDPIRNFWRANA